jgi:hypothetical protein
MKPTSRHNDGALSPTQMLTTAAPHSSPWPPTDTDKTFGRPLRR